MSPARGLWITCGASKSPWNTHLSSEEYELDAKLAGNAQLAAFSTNLFGDPDTANPYDYGHLPEVVVRPDGTGFIRKHYCVGRISHELVQVMPDERTVIMGDDATNGGLFMFIADRPRDLSAGTLYAARWTQVDRHHGCPDQRPWNCGLHADLLRWQEELGEARAGHGKGGRLSGNASVRRIGRRNDGFHQDGGHDRERRRQARVLGNVLHLQVDDRRHHRHPREGVGCRSRVRAHSEGRQLDSEGQYIHSEWVSTHMHVPEGLVGEDLAVRDSLGNSANPDKIANPDNLKYSEAMRTLFIGEDSGHHVNNFLWAYNVDTRQLSRILSCPAGAESTGLHAVDDVNGFSYIMSNFRHPGDWESPLHDVVRDVLEPLEAANYNCKLSPAVGYLAITGRID